MIVNNFKKAPIIAIYTTYLLTEDKQMPILADQHTHSSFSADSKASMESMIDSAMAKGLRHICFTEHNDFKYPESEKFPKGTWDLNIDSYLYDLLTYREKYDGKINIGFGVEIGLQDIAVKENTVLANSQKFDFIIGSVHVVNGVDTYEPSFYEGRPVKEAINEYFDCVIKNVGLYKSYDVLGHLDYLTRTLPGHENDYRPDDYMDKIDVILKTLIHNGKGLELNTQTLGKGYKYPNPWPEVLKRYKELGGEIITIGSDAHKPEAVAAGFDKAGSLLTSLGFKYYSIFTSGVAVQIDL